MHSCVALGDPRGGQHAIAPWFQRGGKCAGRNAKFKRHQNLIAKNSAQIQETARRFAGGMTLGFLTLDEGVTDVATLPKMEFARSMLNSTLMDLMYYQSPLYRTEIVNGVIRCLNSIYTTFKANNPNFDGTDGF
ncbi:hypothetical protein niasHS_000401 [Heterodera schachtii]|uniref:Uncharacterized protein n=1 Tax=Heterodera schachtii TaxID=97005 RepID=A0ABD2KCX5_HETSC